MERWKRIINFPDYKISSLGKIERITTKSGTRSGKILKQNYKKNGYVYICLTKNNKKYYKRVHRLVLETFNPIENINKLECNHINGIKSDNRLENLEWCTRSENEKHAYKIGLKHQSIERKKKLSDLMKIKHRGEKNPRSKLTEKQVIQIKMLFKLGFRNKYISEKYNISIPTVSQIRTKKLWCYINV